MYYITPNGVKIVEEIRNDTIPASFGEHLPRRSSPIFFTGFLFCFTVVAACQLDNGSIFLEARREGREIEGGNAWEIARIQTKFPSSFLFLHFSKRDDIETSRKLPRLILVRKIQELADSGEIKSCHGIK